MLVCLIYLVERGPGRQVLITQETKILNSRPITACINPNNLAFNLVELIFIKKTWNTYFLPFLDLQMTQVVKHFSHGPHGPCILHGQYMAIPISRGHFSPNNSRNTPIARSNGRVWLSSKNSKSDWCFTFEVVVLRAISCYVLPRYIESLSTMPVSDLAGRCRPWHWPNFPRTFRFQHQKGANIKQLHRN